MEMASTTDYWMQRGAAAAARRRDENAARGAALAGPQAAAEPRGPRLRDLTASWSAGMGIPHGAGTASTRDFRHSASCILVYMENPYKKSTY